MGLVTGSWSGIPNLAITIFLGMLVICISAFLAEKHGKKKAPYIMVGVMVGLQMMVSFTSSKNCSLMMNNQDFFIIAGSLMYPILACGDDYLNEFYGKDIAKCSVKSQLITRILSTLYLIWLIYLPCPTGDTENYTMFATLMNVVPRVTVASIIATYIGGIMNVNIFSKIKEKTDGKMLWLRTFISTAIGLLFNIVLFTLLAFVGVKSISQMLQMILISVVIRIFTSFIEIAFLYAMRVMNNKLNKTKIDA